MKTSFIQKPKPTSSDMIDVLRQLEAEDAITCMHVKGVPIWPLLRIRWFFSEWVHLYTKNESAAVSPDRLKKYWHKLKRWIARVVDRRLLVPIQMEGHRSADIVFLSDGISFAKLENDWFERFCDPLIEQAEQIGLCSVMWSPVDVGQSPTRSRIWSAQASLSFGTLLAALLARIDKSSVSQFSQVDLLATKLKSIGYQATQFSRSKVLTDAYRVRILSRIFQRRLAIVKPRLAFIVSYYSLEGMSFVWACKNLGIPVVDLQHGVQGPLHPAYAGWRVNGIRETTLPLVPDCFWVWSAGEAGVIREWVGNTFHRPYVGGNPWVNLWKECANPLPDIIRLTDKGKVIAKRASGRPIVLVTLQYGLDYAEQLMPLKTLIELAAKEYVFWVRLHPLMMERREEIRHFLDSQSVELDEVSDFPLPALLPYCNVHVTHSSSTVIEAGDYGILSLITSRFGVELFLEQLSAGTAVDASGGPAEVYRALGQAQQKQCAGQQQDVARDHTPLEALLDMLGITATGTKKW
jgi:hypothetical protein